ncbi:MAG: dTMP kinase [Nanoarchaeota archaeon]
MDIYIATPVSAPDLQEDIGKLIYDTVKDEHNVLTAHLFKENVLAYEEEWMAREIAEGCSGNVYERDLGWLRQADCVIVNAAPSLGMGIEVGYAAFDRHIPVLLLYREDFRSKFAWQNTNPFVTRAPYTPDDREGIVHAIHAFLEHVLKRQDAGIFLSFEGIEACGKDTQIKRSQQYLQENSIEVVVSREPGGTSLGEAERKLLLHPEEAYSALALPFETRAETSEVFLYLTARAEFFSKIVQPRLLEGGLVIANRFADSTTAYQGGGRFHSDPMMLAKINQLNDFAIRGRWPDMTFYLQIDYETMIARSVDKKLDFMERLGRQFFEQTIAAYDTIGREHPHRVVVIDGKKERDRIFQEDIRPRLDRIIEKLKK